MLPLKKTGVASSSKGVRGPHQPLTFMRTSPLARGRQIVTCSTKHEGTAMETTKSRRFAVNVLGTALASLFASGARPMAAFAGQYTGRKTWDGTVKGGNCELGEEGDECRLQEIGKDQKKLIESVRKGSDNAPTSTSSQAVSKIDEEYFKSTDELIQEINAYLELDVFDKRRREATGEIQTNGKTWVSKYAPGGSARLQSAQKIYVIVDSLLGHFAQNGFAPLPQDRKTSIQTGMESASLLLAQNK